MAQQDDCYCFSSALAGEAILKIIFLIMSGKFIVIYGVNNIGKTTHAKRLFRHLRQLGKKAVYIKYPVYKVKPSGEMLNKILRSGKPQKMSEEELQMLYVFNRYQFQPTLQKWLSERKIVVAEDYTGTGIAWGLTKGAKLNRLELMNKFLVQPDLEVLLCGRRKISAREKKHLHEESNYLLNKCAKVLNRLQKRYGWGKIKIAKDKDATEREIWKIVKTVIN